jgi:hypothetical protein
MQALKKRTGIEKRQIREIIRENARNEKNFQGNSSNS